MLGGPSGYRAVACDLFSAILMSLATLRWRRRRRGLDTNRKERKMPGETVIVQTSPQPGDSSQPATPVAPQQIDQAVEFGQMREAFRQTQAELQETRSAVQTLQSERQTVTGELQALRERQERLIQIAEQETQREAEVTVIAPVAETPKTPEPPAKQKQSKLNRFLFGNEDEP